MVPLLGAVAHIHGEGHEGCALLTCAMGAVNENPDDHPNAGRCEPHGGNHRRRGLSQSTLGAFSPPRDFMDFFRVRSRGFTSVLPRSALERRFPALASARDRTA